MREIKFRAWDINEDEYISWEGLIRTRYNQDYFKLNGKSDIILSMMTDKHILLEQYTGLRDKNGKEIYENDVIRDGEYSGTVIIGNPKDMTINCQEYKFNYCGVYADIAGETDIEYRCYFENWEVIGNIHEKMEATV